MESGFIEVTIADNENVYNGKKVCIAKSHIVSVYPSVPYPNALRNECLKTMIHVDGYGNFCLNVAEDYDWIVNQLKLKDK